MRSSINNCDSRSDAESGQARAQALALAKRIRKDNGWRGRFNAVYWSTTFLITLIIEKYWPQRLDENSRVLNFGCGISFHEGAVNADVFVPHRWFRKRRRPDFYWTGLTELPQIHDRFTGIVCEHVIEHMLPDTVSILFLRLFKALAPGGTLVVSFPDVRSALNGTANQGYSHPMVSANAMIYLYGHRFMYDAKIIQELLEVEGFADVRQVVFDEAPLKEFLNKHHKMESLYITAYKSATREILIKPTSK